MWGHQDFKARESCRKRWHSREDGLGQNPEEHQYFRIKRN